MELANIKTAVRKIELRSLHCSARPTSFKVDTESKSHATRICPKERVPGPHGSSKRMSVVVKKHAKIQPLISKGSRNLHYNRRLGCRMGGADWRQITQRSLGTASNRLAHKSKRALRSVSHNSKMFRRIEGKNSPYPVRQQIGSGIHKKSGGDEVKNPTRFNSPPLNICQSQDYKPSSTIYTGKMQRPGRQPFPEQTNGGLALIEQSDRSDISEVGRTGDRLVCDRSFQSSPKLCDKKSKRSASDVHRCFQQDVGIQACLAFPSSSSGSSSPETFEFCEGDIPISGSSMGQGFLEARHKTTSSGTSFSDSKPQPPYNRRGNRDTSSAGPKIMFGGLENTGWTRFTEKWIIEDRELLEKSWRKSSLKTYKAPWKCWLAYAKSKGIEQNDPKPEDIALYLSYLHRLRKLAPATIRVHKSVVATLANPMKSEFISDHPLVKHMIRAIDLSKPPQVKKFIWDVNVLVTWIKKENIDQTSLFQVSRRVALLLLLASGRRIHDLTLLSTSRGTMEEEENSITFWPEFGSKTDKSSHRQSGWRLTKCQELSVDPVFWIRLLINLSADRRGTRAGLTQLFITSRGKVVPASRTVIAGWIKTALKSAGIEYSPGSIRSAVASSRYQNEMPIDTILADGNWKGKSNFLKFYYKEINRTHSTSETRYLTERSFQAV